MGVRGSLDDLMSLDGTIARVRRDGSFERFRGGVYAPEITMETDDDGQISSADDAEMVAGVERQGWKVETGWSGQYLYSGPVMHESEYIGGALEKHILATPGLWCALPVEVDSPQCPNESETCSLSDPCVICEDGTGNDRERDAAGWVLVHRPVPVTLGDAISLHTDGSHSAWPVIRDGKETGTHVVETERGYRFRAPHTMTEDGFGFADHLRVTRDDARKDAAEWLTENVA